MHLSGRSRAHVPLAAPRAPRSMTAHERPPRGLQSAARWGAPCAAVGCTGGRPLGGGRAPVLRALVPLVARLIGHRRRHMKTPSASGRYSPELSSRRAPARIPRPLSSSRLCRRRGTPAAVLPAPPGRRRGAVCATVPRPLRPPPPLSPSANVVKSRRSPPSPTRTRTPDRRRETERRRDHRRRHQERLAVLERYTCSCHLGGCPPCFTSSPSSGGRSQSLSRTNWAPPADRHPKQAGGRWDGGEGRAPSSPRKT